MTRLPLAPLALFVALAAAPLAQEPLAPEAPALAPEDVRALMGEAAARGWVAAGTAERAAACAETGFPVSRAGLVGVVARDVCETHGGCDLFRALNSGRPPAADSVAWADSLRAVGLITAPEARRLRRFAGAGFLSPMPGAAARPRLTALPSLLARFEAASPALLRDDAEAWVRAGLMTPEAARAFVGAARAGTLPDVSHAAPWLAVARPISAPLAEDWRAPLTEPLLREAVEVANAFVERPLALGAVRTETTTREGYAGDEDTVHAFVAELDGDEVRREQRHARVSWEALPAILNAALRERGSPFRVGLTAVVFPERPPVAQALLVALTEPQSRALHFDPEATDASSSSSARQRLWARAVAAGDVGRDACDWSLTFPTLALLDYEPVSWLDGRGPRFDDAALTRDSVRATYARFAAAGLVPADSVDALARRYLARPYGNGEPHDLLALTPALHVFDWEATEYPPDYDAEIARWAAVTRGAWAPEAIRQRPLAGADSVEVGFRVGGRAYREAFEVEGDWFQPGLLALIVRATREAGAPGRFHWLDGSRELVVFLSPEAAADLGDLFPELAPVTGGE